MFYLYNDTGFIDRPFDSWVHAAQWRDDTDADDYYIGTADQVYDACGIRP